MDRNEILAALRPLVADSLAIEPDEVTPASRLVTDLGADSLDFVDMIFAVEKRFGIKIREGELDFLSRLDFSAPGVLQAGYLTKPILERLRPWLPALALAPDPGRITPGQVFSFLTVETLAILVEKKLAGGSPPA